MIMIYLSVDDSIPKKFIYRCQINPDKTNEFYRTDLQFYVGLTTCRSPSFAITWYFTTI